MEAHAYVNCFICMKSPQMGPHRYEGFGVKEWGVTCCESSVRHTPDGVVETPDLLERMSEHGIEPRYNRKGHIVVPR